MLIDPLPSPPPIQDQHWGRGKTLPTGTVTFLFTDIQGSTPLWERASEKMAEALQVHNAVLRKAIEANGGVVFKTVGDAFQSAFATAPQALKAAIQGQRALKSATWNELGPLQVRMGLHTGEAELDPGGDEYAVSHTKNRAARIMSAAYGGQILLSQEAKDLVDHQLPGDITIKDLGDHHLKGMEWLEHLYQVVSPDLPQEFPHLSSSTVRPNNLPVQMTSFVGREKEIHEVMGLVRNNRMVTLTGSGGTGKTRLSLQVAEEMLEQFPNGTWLVELAALGDPDLVPRTTIAVLGLVESSSQGLVNQLINYLREKNLLLLLDNCEHVIEDCARMADELLRACPKLKILASSREALGVAGETTYRVPSLSTPDPRQMPALEEFSHFPAVRLFAERAASAQPGFAITSGNAPALSQICRRLDGIPLAIELAAARINVLSVEQIATRLHDRFRLLTGGSRTALPRQQTLRASIDWSFSLLNALERSLLMRLSVFYGGWTLEAANQVCSFEGLDEYGVIDGLAQLANKSLIVVAGESNGGNRYHMLETIRQYAGEKLFDSGEASLLRNRHLEFFMSLAEAAEPHLRGPQQVAWLDRLEMELDNLRASLEWALEENPQKGLILATAIYWLWHIRGYRVEGEHWLDQLIEKLRSELYSPSLIPLLAKSRLYQSFLRLATGGASPRTTQIVEEARLLASQLGEAGRLRQAYAMHAQVWNAYLNNQSTAGFTMYLEALAIAQEEDDRFLAAEFLQHLANFDPDLYQTLDYAERNLVLRKELGDLDGQMMAYLILAGRHFSLGNLDLAREMYLESFNLAMRVKNRWGIMITQYGLGLAYSESGNFTESTRYLQQSLTTALEYGEFVWTILALNALGHTMALSGEWVSAKGYFHRAIDISRLNNAMDWEVRNCIILAEAAWATADFKLAEEYYQAASVAGQKQDARNLSGLVAYGTGKLALMRGDLNAAKSNFRISLVEAKKLNSIYQIRSNLEALTALYVPIADKAARLRGAVENLRQVRLSWGFVTIFLAPFDLDYLLKPARDALGKAEYERLYKEGQAMTLEQSVALAMEENE